MEEYRDTGWYDVECTKNGLFRRNNRNLKLKYGKHRSPYIVVKIKGTKRTKEKAGNMLIAKAWCESWFDDCCVIPIDGNQNNIHADNLHICDKDEFASYKQGRRRDPNVGYIGTDKYGVFKETPVKGLYCTIDGTFRRNNRIVPLHRSKSHKGIDKSLRVTHNNENGKTTTSLAARLVAQTWSPQTWFDDCVIVYKDGDFNNIHSDNLILVESHKYFVEKGRLGAKVKAYDFNKARQSVELRAKEALIALRYFQTGCMDEFNIYVKNELTPLLSDYINNFGRMPNIKQSILSEVLSILYEYVLSNRPIASYTHFCKHIIRKYMKTGRFGYYENQPNNIERSYVSQLNLYSLCERYKMTKLK